MNYECGECEIKTWFGSLNHVEQYQRSATKVNLSLEFRKGKSKKLTQRMHSVKMKKLSSSQLKFGSSQSISKMVILSLG